MHRPLRSFVLFLSLVLFAGLAVAVGQSSSASPPSEAHGADLSGEVHDHDHADEDDHEHDQAHADDHANDHDQNHDHGDEAAHDHGPGVAGTRLLVAEADGATLVVLDLASGAELARFGTPGPGSVHQLPDPQLAVVVHRADHRITFVHSGLTEVDHGDHADLVEGNPYVLQTVNVGLLPTGVSALGNDLAFYNDGDGTVAWLDRRLLGVSLDYRVLDGRGLGEGTVVVQGDHAYVGYARTGHVDVADRTGGTVATFEGCAGLRGAAPWASGVAFGCRDGVLLIEARPDGTFEAQAVANPAGSREGVRVDAIVGDAASETLVGAFGRGIAIIDPTARSLTPVALPASPLVMRFAEAGEVLLALTTDGLLLAVDPTSGEVVRSVAVIEAFEPRAPLPAMTVLGEHVYVADPRHDEVVEVHVDAFEIERRLSVPFAPGGLAALSIPGAIGH